MIRKSKVKNSVVIIDIEYDGYSDVIYRELVKNTNQNIEFRFSNIGKRSPAHKSAYSIFKKLEKANHVTNLNEFKNLMMKMVVQNK